MISNAKGHQTQLAGYYSPEAVEKLKALSKATRVPQSAYLREALDDLLKKHEGHKNPRGIANAGQPIGSTFSPAELFATADAVKAKFDEAKEPGSVRSSLGRALGKLRQGVFWQAQNLKSRGL